MWERLFLVKICRMIITYHGMQCFRVQFGGTTLVFDPISKESKLKSVKFGADIALSSLNHPDTNGVENAEYAGKAPFAITSPGEYEIKDVTIKGFPSKSDYGGKERINTIYTVNLENMNICFLGAMKNGEIGKETAEAFEENIDILFVPIGGDGVLNPAEAHKLTLKLEPKLVIPMHYAETGGKGALSAFLKESSSSGKPTDKLTIKMKDIEGKSAEVAVLSAV